MNVIVDTHVIIWFISDEDQITVESKKVITNPENICFVSVASLWEMGIKYSLGKLELKAELKKVFNLIVESGFHLLPVTPDHVLTNTNLEFHHRDPFDRMIIAQAKSEGFSVLTKDRVFDKYDVNLVGYEP